MFRSFPWLGRGSAALLLVGAIACTPEIGDRCTVSTDCSVRGDRLCDTSQPEGYCTQLNCQPQSCADETVCVLFNSAVPGCGYDDRSGPFGSRVARSFCMAPCESNSDCRPRYVCADPRSHPWNAVILDDNQDRRACLPAPAVLDGGADAGPAPSGKAPVCGPASAPITPIDAGPASVSDAGALAPPLFPSAVDAATSGG